MQQSHPCDSSQLRSSGNGERGKNQGFLEEGRGSSWPRPSKSGKRELQRSHSHKIGAPPSIQILIM